MKKQGKCQICRLELSKVWRKEFCKQCKTIRYSKNKLDKKEKVVIISIKSKNNDKRN